MSTTTLKFFVKEDGSDFSICDMTEPETAAISECISDLIPAKYQFTSIWFEADTCILEEDEDDDYEEPKYGLLRCYRHHPNPKSFSQEDMRLPAPIPQEVLDHLAGKTFIIRPTQYGLNPWGKKVEVIFESILSDPEITPAQTPNTVPISVLIAAALQKQTKPPVKVSDLISAALKSH